MRSEIVDTISPPQIEGSSEKESVISDDDSLSEFPFIDWHATETGVAAKSAFHSVLVSESTFVDYESGQAMTVDGLIEDMLSIPGITEAGFPLFSVVDLDADSVPEIILWGAFGELMHTWGFEVLRYADEQVYRYHFNFRALNQLKSDGSFDASGGAANHGILLLQFVDNAPMKVALAWEYDGDPQKIRYYKDNNIEIEEEEFLAIMDLQQQKDDAFWFDYDDKSLQYVFGS